MIAKLVPCSLRPASVTPLLARIYRCIPICFWTISTRVLGIGIVVWVWIGVRGRIRVQAAGVRAAYRTTFTAERDAIPHPSIAGKRAGNAARRLLFPAVLHIATQLDRAVSYGHIQIVVAQRWFILQRILDLILQSSSVIDGDAHVSSRAR